MSARVIVALRVRCAPEHAFEAFTRDIALWWRPNIAFRTTPRDPGVLAFDGQARLVENLSNGKVFEIGKVLVWDPPARLAFTWRQATFPPDLVTTVEVEFRAVGEETRIEVIHAGFDAVPQGSVDRHGWSDAQLLQALGGWWREQLQRVQAL